MKFFIRSIFLLAWTISASLSAYSIAFVHIGTPIPNYALESIEQAHLFNPEATIYFITSKHLIKQPLPGYVRIQYIEDLPRSKNLKLFYSKTKWKGFWKYAIERFFYLHAFALETDEKDIFHIETDVMVYADLGRMLHQFQFFNSIMATFDHDKRCIPGFMYFPGKEELNDLTEFLSIRCRHLTDMEAIALFWNSGGNIHPLPISTPEYNVLFGLENLSHEKPKDPSVFVSDAPFFKGIFDAAAFGQYLGGDFHSQKPFINETAYISPPLHNIEWMVDSYGRRIPYVATGGSVYPIINLHIHSKRLHEFRSL